MCTRVYAKRVKEDYFEYKYMVYSIAPAFPAPRYASHLMIYPLERSEQIEKDQSRIHLYRFQEYNYIFHQRRLSSFSVSRW